jgi:hypothetical protein
VFEFLIIAGLVLLTAYLINRSVSTFRRQRSIYYKNAEMIGVLLDLDPDRLNEVLTLYRKAFGPGAARYAKTTLKKWKAGKVLPTRRTFDRFYRFLAAEMSFDLKCEIVRTLKDKYCEKDEYELNVTTSDWKQTLPPVIRSLSDKARTSQLPKDIQERVEWLAQGEALAANAILAESQARETESVINFLEDEFVNIEALIEKTNGRAHVRHSIKLPYGTILLRIDKN